MPTNLTIRDRTLKTDLTNLRKLNIGCGNDVLEGYINLDVAKLPGVDVIHNLREFPWPFDGNMFEEIKMIHALEHLPNTIRTIEEVWRITKHEAKVTIRVPYWNCWHSIGDLTHVKRFHQKSFDFFDPEKERCQKRPYYSHARFKVDKTYYWIPILPMGSEGKGWVRIRNNIGKGILSLLATYLNNIIWCVEFEHITIKENVANIDH